jgi:tubulin gamma chain
MYTIRGLFTNAQVINNIMKGPYKSLYNPENVYRNEAGGGAGNNWAQGYAAGEKAADELIEMVDREADGSESLEVRALNSHTRGFSCYIL